MGTPLGYFLTWTTYGTWLPGDDRTWWDKHDTTPQMPDPELQSVARGQMKERPVFLEPTDRDTAAKAMHAICARHQWTVHALEVRRSHVHAVVSAGDMPPGRVLGALKAAGSKGLNRRYPSLNRTRWWTRDGSKRYLNDETSLVAAIRYTLDQDVSWLKHI